MDDLFGKKINVAFKSDVRLAELIDEFWRIFNDVDKMIGQKKTEIKNILGQVEKFYKDDQDKFFKSINPENSEQSVLSCLKLVGVKLDEDESTEEKIDSINLKNVGSTELLFDLEDEPEQSSGLKSPRFNFK